MKEVAQDVVGKILENKDAAVQFIFTLSNWIGWVPVAILCLIGLVTCFNLIAKKWLSS
jgi:hypothetical protein